jgi:RHS repeat-associated protein
MFYTQYTARDSETGACTNTGETGSWAQRSRTVECPRGFVWDSTAKYCYRTDAQDDPYKHNEPDCPANGTNPINASQGFKIQIETDYTPPGSGLLKLQRFYSSNRSLTQSSGLSRNWRHTWRRSVQLSEAYGVKTLVAYRENHNRYYFTSSDQGQSWVREPDVRMELTSLGSAGWKLTLHNGEEEYYGANGFLSSIVYPDGRSVSLQYEAGMLARVLDETGRSLEFSYVNGWLTSVTAPGGLKIVYSYSSTDMLQSVEYQVASGTSTSRQYLYENATNPFFLTGLVDERGQRVASWAYDSNGRAMRSVSGDLNSSINRYSIGYDLASGNVSRAYVTDPLGQQRTYSFGKVHGKRLITSVSAPCPTCGGNAASFTYNSNGQLEQSTDFKGFRTRYTYNARGLETSKTEAQGTARQRVSTTDWHATLRKPVREVVGNLETTYEYNARGQLALRVQRDVVAGTQRTTSYAYYEVGEAPALVGLLKTVTGPDNATTTYEYYDSADPAGNFRPRDLKAAINPLGHRTEFLEYDGAGQVVRVRDPNGVETVTTYHPRGWLASRSSAGLTTTYEYKANGLISRITEPAGNYLNFTYDVASRLTAISDSAGNRIEYTLDALGNRTAERVYDPSNTLTQTRTRVFNTLNRLSQEIGAAGTTNVTTTFGYDNNGNQTSIAAPLNRTSGQGYDELNRLTRITDPLSGVTQYGYNALDQLISVTDPRNKVTNYTYNALGDLTEQVSPDTGTTSNTYDSAGNLLTSTDARGKTATYSYDALNRVTSLTYADQTIGYTYDGGTNQNGRLTQVTDASGSTSWAYDPQGRVLSRQQAMGVTKTVNYAYDFAGRLQTLTLPSGNAIAYGYTDDKVTSLMLNGSTVILSNVLYRPFGPIQSWQWGNGTFAVREYDNDGLITDIDSAGLKSYSYDDAFRITAITDAIDPNGSQSYGYDLLDRLTSATGTSLNQSWTYDANGNRLTQGGSQPSTYTVSGTSNRLSSVAGALTRTFAYDAAGNTTSDGSTTITYNDAGRMISATKAGVTTTYTLNALGQRVKKTVGTSSTYFAYDEAGHLVGEYNDSGALVQETIWLGDIPVGTIRPNGSGVDLFYTHSDHLNTPRKISRPDDNTVVWRWDADPFGAAPANDDPDGDGMLFVYGLRFPGQYFDVETGLHYNFHRDGYDPAAGRYTQSDPIGLAGGVATFAYASNDPMGGADPFGLFRVRAREMYDGTWNYEFQFEPTCLVQSVKDFVLGRGLGRLGRLGRSGVRQFGPRHAGSVDISDKEARCRCLGYDDALEEYFRSRGFSPYVGVGASNASQFSERDAQQMLRDLRKEMRRVRREECTTDECRNDEDLYPWDQLLDIARQRGTPFIGNIIR